MPFFIDNVHWHGRARSNVTLTSLVMLNVLKCHCIAVIYFRFGVDLWSEFPWLYLPCNSPVIFWLVPGV